LPFFVLVTIGAVFGSYFVFQFLTAHRPFTFKQR
jgi:hypothetical protein